MSERRANYFCNLERTEELNNRIFERNITMKHYNPVFERQPQSTKYQKFPITQPFINDEITIGHGTKWTEYSENVNRESVLRNQLYPRSNSTSSHYIPSSESELYNREIIENPNSVESFQYLFKEQQFNNTDIGILGKIGNDNFNNATRQQLKNI